MVEHTVELGGQTAPDQLLLQILDTDERPVTLVNLPNPVTIGVWPGCSRATLLTEVEPVAHIETDGDIRFKDGHLLSEVGAIDWPPGDPNPPGMEPTDPAWQPPEVFDGVNRNPTPESYDMDLELTDAEADAAPPSEIPAPRPDEEN